MKNRLLIIILLLAVKIEIIAQGNPALTLKNFYSTIQKSDTAAFIKYFLSSQQIKEILNSVMSDTLNVAVEEPGSIDGYKNHLIRNEYDKIKMAAGHLKLDLGKATFSCVKYEIVNEPQYLFPSFKGSIFIQSSEKFYELQIEEAVFIEDNWKIIKAGNLQLLMDTSILKKNKEKLTAFNSINFEMKVSEIKVEEINHLPPPPPPPPPKKRKSS
jgi:hypothetical protein